MGVSTDQTGLVLGQNNVFGVFFPVISLQLMKDTEKYIHLKDVNFIISTQISTV